MSQHDKSRGKIGRRQYLGALALSSAAAVAGCFGGNGGGDGGGEDENEQAAVGSSGERAPTLEIEYWPDMGGQTFVFENAAPIIAGNIEEHLGLDVEMIPVGYTTNIANQYDDERSAHMHFNMHSLPPDRLDPHELTDRFNILNAGEGRGGNLTNFANCDHSMASYRQSVAETEEDRREWVNEAYGIMSEEVMVIPFTRVAYFGAYWTDQVEVGGLGQAGLTYESAKGLIQSSGLDGAALSANINPTVPESTTHVHSGDTATLVMWNYLFYSPLLGYNENYELENVLAESYEVADNGTTFTFTLREGGEFHNGEPITAEDVQWTWQYLADNSDIFPMMDDIPLDSIEIIDDRTVEINMTEPYLLFTSGIVPRWGIFPKDVWQEAGAEDNPGNFELDAENLIGSGPYQIDNFDTGQAIQASPHDGHPVFETDSELNLVVFDNTSSAANAFRNNEINMFLRSPPGPADELRQMDGVEVVNTEGFLNWMIYPQKQFGYGMFPDFCEAVSQVVDRENINETVLFGESEEMLHATNLSDLHPWYPGEENLRQIADSPTSNPDTARQILEENGWTWDDNNNLHYPEDIDLTPVFSQGEAPRNMPDEFPCVEDLQS